MIHIFRTQAILLSVLFVIAVAPGIPAFAATNSSALRTAKVSSGVRLSLVVPQQTYPLNALVGVQVALENLRSTSVKVLGSQSDCGFTLGLGVQVRTTQGEVRYPPALAQFAPLCSGRTPSLTLEPGQSVYQTVYAVLRAKNIQATAEVELTRGGTVSAAMTLHTGTLTVHLVNATAPYIVVHHASTGIFARVALAAPHHGPLLYAETIRCRDNPNGGIAGGSEEWSLQYGPRISPSCSPVTSWQIVAGWIGHPVVSLNYTAP